MKRHIVRGLQKYVLNPPIRLQLALGMGLPGHALIETTGRVSGRRRRTPVGNGLVADTFWLVAEHGHQAAYVRNLAADPNVRVKVRCGWRYVWRSGRACILDDDDPRARQRKLGRGHPIRWLTARAVRGMGTDLLTIRVDLDPPAAAPPPHGAGAREEPPA